VRLLWNRQSKPERAVELKNRGLTRGGEPVADALHARADEQGGVVVGDDPVVDVEREAVLLEAAQDHRVAFSGCIGPCPFVSRGQGDN
jgi:hypothetical protein